MTVAAAAMAMVAGGMAVAGNHARLASATEMSGPEAPQRGVEEALIAPKTECSLLLLAQHKLRTNRVFVTPASSLPAQPAGRRDMHGPRLRKSQGCRALFSFVSTSFACAEGVMSSRDRPVVNDEKLSTQLIPTSRGGSIFIRC
jgi:hypothetical protein